jgi:hypothetical protein
MIDENTAPYISPSIGAICFHCPRTTCNAHFYIPKKRLGRQLACDNCGLEVTIGSRSPTALRFAFGAFLLGILIGAMIVRFVRW